MPKLIILLAGEARAGKDTSADVIQKILTDYNFTHGRSYFAKALKESAKIVFGLTDDHVFGSLKETPVPVSISWEKMTGAVRDQLHSGYLSHLWAGNSADNLYMAHRIVGNMLDCCEDFKHGDSPDCYMVSPRQIMQWWGTEAVRKAASETAWVDAVQSEINQSQADVFIVSDTRFDNEVEYIKEKNLSSAILCIRLHRGDKVQVHKHVSEAGISDGYVDYEVSNNGSMAELEESLHNVLFDEDEDGVLRWLEN